MINISIKNSRNSECTLEPSRYLGLFVGETTGYQSRLTHTGNHWKKRVANETLPEIPGMPQYTLVTNFPSTKKTQKMISTGLQLEIEFTLQLLTNHVNPIPSWSNFSVCEKAVPVLEPLGPSPLPSPSRSGLTILP